MTTAQDFLDLMPIVADREWMFKPLTGFIRDRDGRCPLCALAHEVSMGSVDVNIAAHHAIARAFKFDNGQSLAINEVINAADLHRNRLRPALMAALGMVK